MKICKGGDNIKAYADVYQALQDNLYENVQLESKTINFPLVGKFVGRENDDIIFVPHLDFIDVGRFRFKENEMNISPLNKSVPKATATKISIS